MKLLFIRFSSIGDIVLTTPLMRCVKKKYPQAEIHYLTRNQYVPLLVNNPFIDKVISYSPEQSDWQQQVSGHRYDRVVDLQKNLRSMLVCLKIKGKRKTIDKLNIRKWIYVNFKINLLPDVHIVNRYFKALGGLDVRYDGMGLDFFLSEEDSGSVASLPESFKSGYLCITCGSRHATKQLPLTLLDSIIGLSPLPCVLLGGHEDVPLADALEKLHSDKVFNACGKFSIGQSAFLVSRSQAIIAADTGLMHIAAALKKRVISVWGNTVPDFGMFPLLPDGLHHLAEVVEIDKLKCRPCSKLGHKKCPRGHFKCMMLQNPHNIVNLAMADTNEVIQY